MIQDKYFKKLIFSIIIFQSQFFTIQIQRIIHILNIMRHTIILQNIL